MAHTIKMGNDGILRITFMGDVSSADFDAYRRDLNPFLEASTPENPLYTIMDSSQTGKLSSATRQGFTEINRLANVGASAMIGASRPIRVFINFLLKSTQRDNVDFFDTDEEAANWLLEVKTQLKNETRPSEKSLLKGN